MVNGIGEYDEEGDGELEVEWKGLSLLSILLCMYAKVVLWEGGKNVC